MGSSPYDVYNIEEELKKSRKIVEKSMGISRKWAACEGIGDGGMAEMVERLRNEEYLKNSFEKALKENMALLKEAQKKNYEYERRISQLEGVLEAGNNEKMMRLEERLAEIERNMLGQSKKPGKNCQRRSNSVSGNQNPEKTITEVKRIKDLEKKVFSLEKAIKSKTLRMCKTQKILTKSSTKPNIPAKK